MRPSPASLGFYVVAYASSPPAQKKALKEGNKREEEEGGGVEVLRSATVRAATANPNPNPNPTPTPTPNQVRAGNTEAARGLLREATERHGAATLWHGNPTPDP